MELISKRLKPKSRLFLIVTVLVVIGILAVQVVAVYQARALTVFSTSGEKTRRPEDLSLAAKFRLLVTGVNVPRPANHTTPADFGLAFETHRIPSGRGHMLEVWSIPADGKPSVVLLFHGYAASKDSLMPTATGLRELGYDTLLVDFYGSGGSSGHDTSIGYFEADDVAASYGFARLRWPDRPLVLYGQSMGAAAVLRSMATAEVTPEAIVLESVFDTLLHTVENRFDTMGWPHWPLAGILLFWGGKQWGFDPFGHNPVDYAPSVTVPALVFQGGGDLRVTEGQARRVYDRLAGPKRFVLIPEAGHRGMAEQARDRWQKHIKEFLSEMEP